MRHPALTRALSVLLMIVSVLTLLSGALSLRKAKTDRQEESRREELLREQINRAAELRSRMEAGQDAYDALDSELPQERDAYETDSSTYKKDLNEYTLSRVGLILGDKALRQAWSALRDGRRQYEQGLAAFQEGKAAFDSIYALYQQAREALNRGWEAWREGKNRIAEGETAPDALQPEDVLTLIDSAKQSTGALETLVKSLREETPEGQNQASQAMIDALRQLQTIGDVSVGDLQSMSYAAGERLYQQARQLAQERIEAGTPEEEAFAEADALVRQSMELGYAELESWLQANEQGINEAVSSVPEIDLSEEQIGLLTDFLPDDRALLDDALSLLEGTEQDLTAKEQELRSDPENVNTPELLMDLLELQLSAAERLFGLFEPQILAARQQMEELSAQMAAAGDMITAGDQAVQEGWRELYYREKDVLATAEELKQRKTELEKQYQTLTDREEDAEAFRDVTADFRSARAALMAHDEIADSVDSGEDLVAAAERTLEANRVRSDEIFTARVRMCILMLLGAAAGVVGALGGFEKPRIKALWLPLILAVLLTAGGEAQSILLGRGLWYTALFVIIVGLGMLPLTIRKA